MSEQPEHRTSWMPDAPSGLPPVDPPEPTAPSATAPPAAPTPAPRPAYAADDAPVIGRRAHVATGHHQEQRWGPDRSRERNASAVIGIALSGIGLASLASWFASIQTPLLLILGAAIGGIVMGLRGWASARNGLATNGALGMWAAVLGGLTILGVIGVYVLVIFALSQWV
ncbi:hypothetical protein [Demequina sp. NBRC 110056]|uniref:hypothetical protein n=1 Tax=Demequina sp. NBRC 110056 TaxID=1570345 RepID=UPI000A00484E|nr:hypothetical protein [Demequina sp. NBRC 110056]